MLADKNNRTIDYLRISVTDRCNLRCIYCMPPEGIINKHPKELLSFEEIVRVAKMLAWLGIRKIRITGGEPLVRKRIVCLIKSLAEIKQIEDVSLTTNGILLSQYADELKDARVKGINISLDTLKDERFRQITGKDCLNKVLDGIDKAKEAGFFPLKLNMVVMKGINDDEIPDFVYFAQSRKLILRFIEFMSITPMWNENFFMSIEEIKNVIRTQFDLKMTDYRSNGPAQYFLHKGNLIGFISTQEINCKTCSRLRLTSIGELKVCLYEPRGLFLKQFLRNGLSDETIKDIIETRIYAKERFNHRFWESSKMFMSKIGG